MVHVLTLGPSNVPYQAERFYAHTAFDTIALHQSHFDNYRSQHSIIRKQQGKTSAVLICVFFNVLPKRAA